MRVPRDLNDPEIGGRYSALSHFGLVPAALIGADLPRLLDGAAEMARECSIEDPGENPGARLGAVLGAMAGERRDKLTLLAEPAFEPLGVWVEQLVAESTGKSGEGILPVEGEPPGDPAAYGDDRLFVYTGAQTPSELEAIGLAGHPVVRLAAREPYELGGEMFRWMFATAVAGHRLGINPFDQPNVESAKVLARKMVAEYRERGALPEPEPALRDGRVSVYGSGAACTAGGGAGGVPLPGQARGLRRATGLRAALESGGRRTAGAAVAGAGPAASGDHGGLRAALSALNGAAAQGRRRERAVLAVHRRYAAGHPNPG